MDRLESYKDGFGIVWYLTAETCTQHGLPRPPIYQNDARERVCPACLALEIAEESHP